MKGILGLYGIWSGGTAEAKVEVITRLQAPETISYLRSFLDMTNFFHSHIPAYSEFSAPLTDLLKGAVKGRHRLTWSVSCQSAFERLKTALVSAPVLRHFDPNLRTALMWTAARMWWGQSCCNGRRES